MPKIEKQPLPEEALLTVYKTGGSYTDCYTTVVPGEISQADYVMAFYTTWLFKLERIILKWLIAKPSTDNEARLLIDGTQDNFAAWTTEARADNQLLMCDFQGRTRSWFMTMPCVVNEIAHTRLYFGSALVPKKEPATGVLTHSRSFRWLVGFHKIYSRALLYLAGVRVVR